MAQGEPVFLGLGANMAEPEAALSAGIERLSDLLTGLRSSRLYVSDPRYDLDQDRFVNAAVMGLCDLRPLDLLRELQAIEQDMGRVRNPARPKGPRIIDIDILLIGERVIDEPALTVPHPRLEERKFALIPLLELEPDLTHPRSGRPLREALILLETQGIYYMSVKDYSSSLSWEGLKRRAWK